MKTFPNHVDKIEVEFMVGKIEVIKMPVKHNLLIFFL